MRSSSPRATVTTLGVLALLAAVLLWRRGSERDSARPDEPRSAGAASKGDAPPDALKPSPAPGKPVATATPEPAPAPQPPAHPLVPGPRLRIHGRVVSASGVGLSGARVELHAWSGREPRLTWSNREGTTGTDGGFEFAIDRELASNGFSIVTVADGSVEAFRVVKLEAYDEARGVDLEVEAARAISGRVLDEGGRPIPGATVQLWYGSETTFPTPGDAEGRFLTPTHAPKRAFELIVEAPGFPRRVVPVPASEVDRADVGDVVFRRGGTLAGVVVDAQGEPIEDLALVVDEMQGIQASSPRTKTDFAGRFEFPDVGWGMVSVWIDGPNDMGGPPGSRRRYRGGVGPVEVGRRDLRIVAEKDCTLVLRFLDAASGEPLDVRPVEYGARLEGTPAPEHLSQTATSSDPLLSVRLSVPSGKRYDVTVRSPGFEEAHGAGVDVRDLVEMTVEIRMRRSR